MQALIDYDGWRKWKDINKGTDKADKDEKTDSPLAKMGKGKSAVPSATIKRDKRLSAGGMGMVASSSGSGSEGTEMGTEIMAGA